MLDSLRKPLFIIALILLVIAVLVEMGSVLLAETIKNAPQPGLGISYLVLIDGMLLYIICLIGVALILPERVYGRVQGVITFIVSLLILLGSIVLIFKALLLLMLMLSLLMAVPFGTIAYFALYADFNTKGAAVTLGIIMSLKLFFAGFLVFSHQRFLQNKSLIFLILTSLLASIIVSFLHGFVPGFLVSITDAIGALVIAIQAAIWAVFLLIGSIPAIIKALRVDRALS